MTFKIKLPHNVLHLLIILLIGHSKRGIVKSCLGSQNVQQRPWVRLLVNTLPGCNFVPRQCLLCSILNKHFHLKNSIQTLVKISKTAGARLKPHASRLIPALLEALSTLEPQVLNYLSLRATEQEKVTSAICCLFTQPCKFYHRLDSTLYVFSLPL